MGECGQVFFFSPEANDPDQPYPSSLDTRSNAKVFVRLPITERLRQAGRQ